MDLAIHSTLLIFIFNYVVYDISEESSTNDREDDYQSNIKSIGLGIIDSLCHTQVVSIEDKSTLALLASHLWCAY